MTLHVFGTRPPAFFKKLWKLQGDWEPSLKHLSDGNLRGEMLDFPGHSEDEIGIGAHKGENHLFFARQHIVYFFISKLVL